MGQLWNTIDASDITSGVMAAARLPGVGGVLHNLAASTAPTVSSDSAAGYGVGSLWVDLVAQDVWACISAAVGAAFWIPVADRVDVQVFTASATWTKTTWATRRLTVPAWIGGTGHGGPGGSGARRAAGVACAGGGGGGGGGLIMWRGFAADLPATLTVAYGASPVVGGAVTTDDTNGAAGTQGGTTWVSGSGSLTWAFRTGAPGGAGGLASTSAAVGGTGVAQGAAGGIGTLGAVGGGGQTNVGAGPAGGGGGGGISAGDVAFAGGPGGTPASGGGATATGGAAPGGAGQDASSGQGRIPLTTGVVYGTSAAGGGASTSGAGGAGGSGTGATPIYGAGGGGGGCSRNGSASGAGGQGGPSVVVIVTGS